ncbi:S26 family signal peptidase [Flavitalea flava]
MTISQVLFLVFIQLLILLLPAPGLYGMFCKAGVPGWKAFVPFYNTCIMQGLAERPKHWVFWQLIPVAGWFFSMGIFVEFVKTFGKFRFYEHALAALLPLVYFPFLGFNKTDSFVGPEPAKKVKKSVVREWADAAIFAIVAATLIRIFVFEAYEIPTGSMEKTLLVGDYLFVSKLAYGPRIPNTPLAVPFVHNALPITNSKSYLEWIKLPYSRWFPGQVKRGDVVVFNLPIGDTLINLPDYLSKNPYYDVIRMLGNGNPDAGREVVFNDPENYPLLITHPVDKRENYIKRCVAIAGDTLQIKEQYLYINGVRNNFPSESETYYLVRTAGQPLDENVMKEEYNLDINNLEELQPTDSANQYHMLLTWQAREKMLANGLAKAITPIYAGTREVFPYDSLHNWNPDNFGPLWIPKKGGVLPLTAENYALYERAIRVYEGNKLERKNGKFFINEQEAVSYTFKMNYFWMMGDNRHGSQDSRFWGFVPEDHIVGKPWRIWMSWEKGVRWNRLLKKVN